MEWDGWEQIYPDDFFNWDPLAELRKLVVLSKDEEFTLEIDSILDLNNSAHFFLLLNLLKAWDNLGKNVFIARYSEDTKLFFLPWDLEAS
jgi:spore coat protein CotH